MNMYIDGRLFSSGQIAKYLTKMKIEIPKKYLKCKMQVMNGDMIE